MLDFYGPGYDVAEQLGLLPALAQAHTPIPHLRFVDQHGRPRFSLAYADLRALFRGRHFNFLRGELERVLLECVLDEVDLRFGTSMMEFVQDARRVEARLTDGSLVAADVLIGADGLHSHTRALGFAPEATLSRFLGYATAAFLTEEVAGVAPDAFVTLTVPGRQVAVYPVPDSRLATFWIYRTPQPPHARTPDAARAELDRVFGGLGWIVPELLARAKRTPDVYWDAVTQIELGSWSQGRVGLVGDACGCVSLLAGQGASLAMAGARVLAEELALAGPSGASDALIRYQRRVQPEVVRQQQAGRRFAHWFVPATPWELRVRDALTRASTSAAVRPLLRRQLALATTKL